MRRKPRIGDYVHWEIIWNTPADLWSVIVSQDGISWTGKCIIPSKNRAHPWKVGATINTTLGDDGTSQNRGGCKFRYVDPDELPDDVLVEITKRTLLDE